MLLTHKWICSRDFVTADRAFVTQDYSLTTVDACELEKECDMKILNVARGVGFEPTKAYSTGYLLSRILSQAHASILDRGMSCPFGLISAHEMSMRRLYWVSGIPAANSRPILADGIDHKPRSTSSDNPRLAPRTSSATSSFNK